MSLRVEIGWDRPASTGESEHWLAVTFRGMQHSGESTSVAVLVDTSTSMLGDRIANARTAVVALVGACRPTDQVIVFGFASGVTRVLEASGGADVAASVGALRAGGKTRLDLALGAAATWLQPRTGARHIVVLTDGDPTDAQGRRLPVGPILETARALGGFGVRTSVIGLGSAENYDASFLRSLADAGGGPSAMGVDPNRLVDELLGALRNGGDEDDVALTIDGAGLEVVEVWRVLPRLQPLSLADQRLVLAVAEGGVVLMRVRLRSQLAGARGPRAVGQLRVVAGAAETILPLGLNIVGPSAPERTQLNAEVDQLRLRVELARTAQLRASCDEPEDQLRHTRRLSELVEQVQDPRSTARIGEELRTLAAGGVLGKDDHQRTIDLLRSGGGDA